MKKILSIIICLLLFIVLFLVSKKQEDSNKVVFWTLQLSSFDKYINKIINEFEKENPGVKIQWIDIPYSEGEKRTLAAVLTDNPPDIVNLTPDFSLLLAQKNALYTIDAEKTGNFIPAVCEVLKYNNQYFGIPFYVTSAITLYNKDLYQGIVPKSYDDLFNIVPSDGTYTTMINFTENDTLLKILNKYNINSAQTINSENSIYLFEKFKMLYDNGYIPKESITQTHREALEKYMSGKLAFLVTGANFINMIKENAPSVYKSTIVIPQLRGSSNLYDYSLMNFVIPKKAKHPEEALKFALYFTNKQNQLDFAKMTPILPVNKYALEDEYFCDNSPKFEEINGYLKYISNSDKDLQTKARLISAYQLNYLQPPLNNIKNKKELNTLSSNAIQEILINNSPVKNVLDDFARSWENL